MSAEKGAKSVGKRSSRLIIAGLFFFINPVFTVLDVLPDAVGCLLLFFGLKQLGYFNESAEKARRLLLYLFASSLIKLLLTETVFEAEFLSDKLLAAAAFSVVEGIAYVLFFKAFFEGINYIAMRNSCDSVLAKSGSTAFLSYLTFFIRIAATLIPELPALFETDVYTETDFERLDFINDLISLKPMLTLMLSLIALGFGVAWFVSVFKLVSDLYRQAGAELDSRYAREYTSRPEKYMPDRIRFGSFVIYFSLIFTLDFAVDNKKLLPFFGMFAVLFFASFMFKGVCEFANTRKFASIACIFTAGAELFRSLFIVPGAVVIYEPELWVAAVSAILAVLAAVFSLLCVRALLSELGLMATALNAQMPSGSKAWASYCAFTVFWVIGYCNSYLFGFVSSFRFIAAGCFICFILKLIGDIKDSAMKYSLLYGENPEKYH